MPFLAPLIVGALVLLVIVGAALGLLAYIRQGELSRRIERLESELRLAQRAPPPSSVHAPPPPAPAPLPQAAPRESMREPAARDWSSAAATTGEPPPIVTAAPAPLPPTPVPISPRVEPQPTRVEPPPPRVESPPFPAPKPRFEWERWLGVRGAAVLGGIFLAITGLLFFQYSIEQGWITPELRVILGTVVGIACMIGAVPLRRRGYRLTADAITSGGAIILYAAFWAAHAHFDIVSLGVSFALMAAVTVACCWLAYRNSSQLIAVLGLAGGFATPLVLASEKDHPVGLFGYVLLLNLGFLFVAQKRRWPAIGLVGLLGTVLIEALWSADRLGPETYAIALVVVGVFALLFVAAASFQPTSDRPRWLASQVGALLLPFAFAIYFAQHADVGWHVYPLVLLSALLAVAAGWMARKQDAPWLPAGASAGSVGVVLTWILSNDLETARAWELAICSAVLAAVYHVFCELRPKDSPRREETERGHALAAAACAAGLLIALVIAAGKTGDVGLWPWIAGALALALLLCRQGALREQWIQPALASAGTGLLWVVWTTENASDFFDGRIVPGKMFPEPAVHLALAIGLSAVFLLAALARRAPEGRRWACWSASVFPLFAFLAIATSRVALDETPILALVAMGILGVAIAAAATASKTGLQLGLAVFVTALAQDSWSDSRLDGLGQEGRLLEVLAVLGASAVLFLAWPFLARARWRESRSVWRFAALSALLWFPSVKEVFERHFGDAAIGLLPLALALPAGACAWKLLREPAEPRSPVDTGRVWYSAAALWLLSMVLPLQVGRDWGTVALALFALALVGLWKRFDRPALKYAAIVLLGIATFALGFAEIGSPYERLDARVWNGHAWDHLVPALAAIAAGLWLKPLELERVRPAERALYPRPIPIGAVLASLAGAFLIFVWLNVAIFNAFAEGEWFRLELERLPARDMWVSIAWALYALGLLVLGVRRRASGPRWVSLGLLLLTIGKVFLFDLGNLQGLHRVASFLGLAVCLLLVSLLYQRFVFGRKGAPAS